MLLLGERQAGRRWENKEEVEGQTSLGHQHTDRSIWL